MTSRYELMEAQRGQHSVEKMAKILSVSPSRYYTWRKSPYSHRKQVSQELKVKIQQIWTSSRERYGSPRISHVLRQNGECVGHNRVARLMREMGIKAKPKRRWRVTTQSNHKLPIADNLLARKFTVASQNTVWAGDITYVPTLEGWLYLAVVMDLYSRKVIGWSMAPEMKTELVLDALNMAVINRRPNPGVLFHSDRGVQYASGAFRDRLSSLGFQQSMSRKGAEAVAQSAYGYRQHRNCWDNACIESFFGSMKQEGCGIIFKSRQEARISIFEYIESFYNRQRIHSTLGYLSPHHFERRSA